MISMSDFKQAVRSAWRAAWDHGEVAALDAIVHPDYSLSNASSGTIESLADLKREIQEVRAAFPDLRTTVDKIVVDGDDFAIFWTCTGTFSSTFREVPATGKHVKSRGSIHGVIRDGRIAHEHGTWDLSNLLADVGVPALRSAFEGAETATGAAGLAIPAGTDLFKGFNRKFVTGVTVVTTVDSSGQPKGLAANAYTSVSLDPPLVLVCVQKTSSTHPALFQSQHLGINILSNSQRATAETFASKTADKFTDLRWHAGPQGSPLLDDSAAAIETEIKERFQAKTHTVFIARVTYAEVSELAPMIYKSGQFYDGSSLQEL
jgi:steroid delta-isomerase-like uncharacterized protein